MSFEAMKISSKVLLIMCSGLCITLLLTVPFLTYRLGGVKKMTLEKKGRTLRNTLDQSMLAKEKVWLTNALQIANNPIVKQAVLQNDRETLKNTLAHYGQIFKQHTGFKNVKIHVIDRNLRSYVKSWAPDDFGEPLDYSAAYKKVKASGAPLVAMEPSPKGLRLKGLFPIMNDGQFNGLVNFEGGLNSIKRSLKPLNIDFLYFLKTDYLDIAKALQGNRKVGGYVLSQKDFDEAFLKHVERLDMDEALKDYAVDEAYLTVAEPVRDVDGQAIGVYLLAQKTPLVMASVAKNANLIWSLFAIMGGAFLIVMLIVAFFLNRYAVKPISRIVNGLTTTASEVASASGQVSSSSESLAEGASEQAASIEETSSSLEEMSSMTRQNADNAGQADTLMKEANQVVGRANDSMNELTTSMEGISKASEETSKIIKTIDEIAFQTNLLALNAAVEAARAGEAGAGFAVVSDEVRNLAMRAAEAAKNTADLIEGTVKKVYEGSALVARTNEAFHQVAESAEKVGGLVGEIAAASNEQAQGIDQVNTAVADMDKVTQQIATNAEESASAAEEMTAQAEQMNTSVAELMKLVGGRSGGKESTGADPRGGSSEDHIPSHSAPRSPSGEWYREQGPMDKKRGTSQGEDGKDPNTIIPMDNQDLKDF
jgi:methyl-accepting chemotaxis protein